MQPFIHLHVHSQYSILDGQASIPALVDKAIRDGMKGLALTDHGNMFGIKEFFNLVKKKNGATKDAIKGVQKRIEAIESGAEEVEDKEKELASLQEEKAKLEAKIFKPIFGCEMYVARRRLTDKEATPREIRTTVVNEVEGFSIRRGAVDEGGYHLVVLAKNLKGYHNLVKLVSKGWTDGFYSRRRTDKYELEKYHEGLIVCSACLGGEIPRRILTGDIQGAEEAILWFKNIFGEDYYLELQRHKATVPRANHETYPLQQVVNDRLIEFSRKHGIKLVCTNDVHFVEEENAEAHDRLICLSTGKDLDDPNRMLYTKQEWLKTQQEMNDIFSDVPEALSNTLEILDKVEFYSIDHPPLMPTFPIPENFGTEEEYRKKIQEAKEINKRIVEMKGHILDDKESLKTFLKTSEKESRITELLYIYTYLKFDEDTSNSTSLSHKLEMEQLLNTISDGESFIVSEFMQKNLEDILPWIEEDEFLKPYKLSFERLYRQKKHILSEKEEKINSSKVLDFSVFLYYNIVIKKYYALKFFGGNDHVGKSTGYARGGARHFRR